MANLQALQRRELCNLLTYLKVCHTYDKTVEGVKPIVCFVEFHGLIKLCISVISLLLSLVYGI